MRKIKITKRFDDKLTGETHHAKSIIERDNERTDYIIDKGFAEEIEEKKPEPKEKKSKK